MSVASEFALTWELDSLLPRPETEAFAEILRNYRAALKGLADASDELPPVNGEAGNVSEWVGFLQHFETLDSETGDLNAFIGCHAAADARNKLFQQLEAQLSSLGPLRQRISTNIAFAFQQTSDDDFRAFLAADDWLDRLRFFLDECREHAALKLPKEQELLAAELGVDGIHAWGRLYDRLSGALKVQVMEKGELVEKSPGQVQMDSPERTVRQNNFHASNKAWGTIADTCADALNHIAGTRLAIYERLGLEDHLTVPCKYNRIERATLNRMWETVTKRKAMLTDYFAAKAELLGLERMSWYDQTAPLALPGAKTKLTYDAACHTVIDTFQGFSPELGDFARMALDERWIEVENRAGKRQGGFCTGFPTQKQSRIFMTFTESPDSMSTLAHELGHAYHSHVLRDQPLFLREYPMGLAETASTFAEAVLGDQQLQTAETPAAKLAILDQMLGDSAAFMMNIHARFIFEDNFHRERAGGELTSDRFGELMLAAQQEAYLNVLADDGWNPLFWASKLHFYITSYPFYNFPYTFGYLLSLGVYALAGEFGAAFPQKYRDLLINTGCMNAEAAVQSTFGYDLTQPDFWNKSLDIVESRVKQYLELKDAVL